MNITTQFVPTPSFYIAGPMTGIAEFNFPQFDEAAAFLETLGYGYINPADIDREQGFDEKGMSGNEPLSNTQRHQFARNDLGALLKVSAILLLPGWEGSTGASNEAMVAGWLGLKAYLYNPNRLFAQRLTPIHLNEQFSSVKKSVSADAAPVAREAETFTNEVGDEFVEYLVGQAVTHDDNWHQRDYGWAVDHSALLEEASGLSEFQRGPAPTARPAPGKPVETPRNARSTVLLGANDLVNGDRNVQYGDPLDDFKRTAAFWNNYLGLDGCDFNAPFIDPHDVAAMMALLKLSRIAWSGDKLDSWMDLAGYAACGWHCVDAS